MRRYNPTIWSAYGGVEDSSFSADSITFKYIRYGYMIVVSGRFNVTNVGTKSSAICISLPELAPGKAYYDMAPGNCGSTSIVSMKTCVRVADGSWPAFSIQSEQGGVILPALGTGYITVMAIAFIGNT